MKLDDKVYFYPERGMLDCNTYVITGEITVVIDPGLEQFLPELIQDMRRDGLDPQDIAFIVNTHLHLDHYWADEALKRQSRAKILLHPLQRRFYQTTVVETSRFFGLAPVEVQEDELLPDRLDVGDLEFEVLPTPGHSPDSLCFYCRSEGILICGDLVFSQSTGRVDLPGGSARELKQSIESIAQLDIDLLLPGHMSPIKGRENIQHNFEFVRQQVFPWL